MGDHAAAARDLLMRAAVLREDGTVEAMSEARDLVAAAHVHALLVQASVTTETRASESRSARTSDDDPVPMSRLILDVDLVAYGESVTVTEVVGRLKVMGRAVTETAVSNELSRAVRRGEYIRIRRGHYSRTRP